MQQHTVMTPPKRIVIGNSDFTSFIERKALLVDKTALIQTILTDASDVLLITRPRRWGKTLNMSMLNYFFSIPTKRDGTCDANEYQQKQDLFQKMNIAAYPEIMDTYCGQYPTIFVTFKDIKQQTYEAILEGIREIICKLYRNHIYLLKSDKLDENDKILIQHYIDLTINESQLGNGLHTLSQLLYKHFGQKVIILIDEYDTPMNGWYEHALSKKDGEEKANTHLQQVLSLFRALLGAALKDNSYLEKAVITGILRIAKANLFSGLNNLGEDSILDDTYASHFGFTEEEVMGLLHETNMDRDNSIVQNLKEWYNGYSIGGITIYNPWSIMNYISTKGQLRPYWIGTASTELLEQALLLDTFQEEVQRLTDGHTINTIADPKMVFTDIKGSPDALHNLLLFSGYLTAEYVYQNADATYSCDVRIPNNEIRGFFTSTVQKWLRQKFNIGAGDYLSFINCLLKGEFEPFITKLKQYLLVSASFYSTSGQRAELFYNGFMIGFLSSLPLDYIIETEKESGQGRIDVVLIPKAKARYKNALIMELKVTDQTENLKAVAHKALEQINHKHYETKIKTYEGVDTIFKIGLAFCGKEAEMVWET